MVNLGCIYICEFCLKFKKSRTSLYRHSVSIILLHSVILRNIYFIVNIILD